MDYIGSVAQQRGIPAGCVMVLPSLFQGGPRCMQQNYQDAMVIVRKFGKPDLFITMTCNPSGRRSGTACSLTSSRRIDRTW